MDIILGKTAGFCYGVTRAVEGAKEELKYNKKIYCLGEIVHNKNVVKQLEEQGVIFINEIDKAEGKVIIRAHGIPKQIYEKANYMNIEIKDLTCPYVMKIHEIAREYQEEKFFIVLLGKKNHPEVIGIKSFCGSDMVIIEDEFDLNCAISLINKSGKRNIAIIAQTTYNSKKFDEIVYKIKSELNEKINLEINKTICPATEVRQKETKDIAKKVDIMIIIGDRKSSNTNKLYNISSKYCSKVVFIEKYQDINLIDFHNVKKIGVMAGASTPKEDIDEVIEILQNGGSK